MVFSNTLEEAPLPSERLIDEIAKRTRILCVVDGFGDKTNVS
jgi:hypothetical protein